MQLTYSYQSIVEDLNDAIADINVKLNRTCISATPSAVPPARKRLRLDNQICDQPGSTVTWLFSLPKV